MLPADIAPRIDMACVELLRRTVVEAADIEHQERIALLQIASRRTVQRALLVDDVKQHPAQHEHRMLAAIELEFIEAAKLVAFLAALRANKPKPRAGPRDRIVPRVGGSDHQRLPPFMTGND